MLGEIRGEVRFKEPLSFHTSLRIGGPADIFVVPQDVEDIRHALMFADREQLPVAVVGGGNNLLVRDRGVHGVILKLEGCLGRAEFHGEEALAGAGVSLSALIREAAALNLGGIESLVGIPATIGGALAMNAGTVDGWIGDFEKAGLRGKRINGAEISSKHANFIVNRGGAGAADILSLMELTRERVHSHFGITLETEIRILGE